MLYQSQGSNAVFAVPLTQAFWYPGAQHGGPLAGLVVELAKRKAPSYPHHIMRLYMSIIRPVMIGELFYEIEVTRAGRKIQQVQVTLSQQERVVARGVVLFYRKNQLQKASTLVPMPSEYQHDGEVPTWPSEPSEHFAKSATDIWVVDGQPLADLGQGAMWLKFKFAQLLDDQPICPAVRLAMISDFGNALSSVIPVTEGRFINADLSLEVLRETGEEKLLLAAKTIAHELGYGIVQGKIFDSAGLVATCSQTVLLEEMGS